jgi:hypothetical protein
LLGGGRGVTLNSKTKTSKFRFFFHYSTASIHTPNVVAATMVATA